MPAFPPNMDLIKIPIAKPPSDVQFNFIDPVTFEPINIPVSAVTTILAISILGIRLFTTKKITHTASYEDLTTILAVLCSISYSGLIYSIGDHARHGWDVLVSAIPPHLQQITFSLIIIAAIGLFLAKLSILLLLLLLFSISRRFRYFAIAGILGALIISGWTMIACTALCVPHIGETWSDLSVRSRCILTRQQTIAFGACAMLLDFYMVALPIPLVWKMQMDRKKKAGNLVIFLTGFM